MVVVLLAVLTAVVSGIDAASLAPQDKGASREETRRREIAARLNEIAAGSIIRIERTDGDELSAVLVEATADAITVVLLDGPVVRSEAIPLSEIKQIETANRRVVRVEHTDGRTFNAMLEDVTPDAITVTILEGKNRAKETIPLGEIRKIQEVRGHLLRNILIGVGVGVGVCTGAVLIVMATED
ncbi:MAG TPA: hypothetical protein VM818_11705 [Vicinamibacterales bacterium]|nr:hypothetical protein [Vicinamibacterales bacterium]